MLSVFIQDVSFEDFFVGGGWRINFISCEMFRYKMFINEGLDKKLPFLAK
jgi:hypothetical protein